MEHGVASYNKGTIVTLYLGQTVAFNNTLDRSVHNKCLLCV